MLQQLIDMAHYAASRNWCPATGGNFSMRLDHPYMAITASGIDKAALLPQDILTTDFTGRVINSERSPSAETLLHAALYQQDPSIQAVCHVHTVANTVLSKYIPDAQLVLRDYEMFKPLRGNTTHNMTLTIPILDNNQDMPILAHALTAAWPTAQHCYGFLVRGHGCYSWGNSIAEAKRHMEALEFLFTCELELQRLSACCKQF